MVSPGRALLVMKHLAPLADLSPPVLVALLQQRDAAFIWCIVLPRGGSGAPRRRCCCCGLEV